MIDVGIKAPDFVLLDNNETEVKLSDYSGKWVILYFYPRDNTPGCTKEACDFTDAADEFNEANAVVLGVSSDSIASHNKFISNYNLKVKLLCDSEIKVIKEYEAWGGEKALWKS
jgi:thioredoxin-dependent peroxiredoxin